MPTRFSPFTLRLPTRPPAPGARTRLNLNRTFSIPQVKHKVSEVKAASGCKERADVRSWPLPAEKGVAWKVLLETSCYCARSAGRERCSVVRSGYGAAGAPSSSVHAGHSSRSRINSILWNSRGGLRHVPWCSTARVCTSAEPRARLAPATRDGASSQPCRLIDLVVLAVGCRISDVAYDRVVALVVDARDATSVHIVAITFLNYMCVPV